MIKKEQQCWIETGYLLFALKGPDALKVEVLAKETGVSKSSFYYHFVDVDTFIDTLLVYHVQQVKLLSEAERACQNFNPAIFEVMVKHKVDLLFNRQLRVKRAEERYEKCLHTCTQVAGDSFFTLWSKDLNLPLDMQQLASIYYLALENFFLRITFENFTMEWLIEYFAELKNVLHEIQVRK
jgi:AcrR family transcriptional regulator